MSVQLQRVTVVPFQSLENVNSIASPSHWLPTSYICVCVYICVYMFMCMGLCICAYVFGGQVLISSIFFSSSPLRFLRQDLSRNLKPWLDWSPSKPGYPPVPASTPQNWGLIWIVHSRWGTELRSLMLVQQSLFQLKHLPSPGFLSLKTLRDTWFLFPANLHSTWCPGSVLKGHHCWSFKIKLTPISYHTHPE